MPYNDLPRFEKAPHRIIVGLFAWTLFLGAFIFVLLIYAFPLGLFNLRRHLAEPLGFFLNAFLFLSAVLLPGILVFVIRKVGKIYIIFTLIIVFCALDALLIWLYLF